MSEIPLSAQEQTLAESDPVELGNTQEIEIRGELTPGQESVCNQLVEFVQSIEGLRIRAIGVGENMVTVGGSVSPRVWFTKGSFQGEYEVGAVTDTFRHKKVAIVSNYSFRGVPDLEVHPFGATLGRYILPDVEIDLA